MLIDIIKFILFSSMSVFMLLLLGYCFLFYFFKSILFYNKYLKVSASYFMGVTLFLSIYRILTMILSNAFLALMISLFLSFLLIIYHIINSKIWKSIKVNLLNIKNAKKLLIYITSVFLLGLFIFFYWSESNFNVSDPFATVGTLHSIRYSNISKYIVHTNNIPLLNQNYGQSLLSTIQLFFIEKGSLFSLIFWLVSSIHFLLIGTFGVLKFFKLNNLKSILGTSIILFGTSSISLVPTLTIDSGSPFFFNGYSDTIVSIGSFLIFFYWYIENVKNLFFNASKKTFIFLFILFFGWNIFAPQNIVFGILVFLVIIFRIIINKSPHKKNVILIFLSILFFAFIGSNAGGMLANSNLIKPIPIKGSMIVMNSEKKISFLPALPYCIYNGKNWEQTERSFGQSDTIKQSISNFISRSTLTNFIELIYRIFWLVETNFWIMLKVLGIPIVGIIGLFYYLKNKNINLGLLYLFEFTISCIFMGIFISFFLQVSNYKWELTRFLIPGVFLGLISFIISMFNNNFFRKKYKIFILTFFLILPNLFLSGIIVYTNIINLNSFEHYIRFLIYY
jgi:hypothetical protein